jgi:transcription antitermination factor NusG
MQQCHNWYIIYTRPRQEKRVTEEIATYNFEYYLPLKTVIRKWSDRIKMVTEPIFSNYVFVKTTEHKRNELFQVSGVVKFLSFAGKVAILKETEINRMRIIEQKGFDIQSEPCLCQGQEIVVKNGPFAGLTGTLVKKMNSCRFLIRLPVLKQSVSVQISEKDLYI